MVEVCVVFVLPIVDRCIWRRFVLMSVIVTVWGSVRQLLKIVFFSLGVLNYMLYVCVRGSGSCVFCLYCDAWSYRCSCLGSMNVSSCRCMFVSCVYPQCCILHDLQFVNAGRGCKRRPYERGIPQSRSPDCLICSHEYLFLFTPFCYCKCFYHL